MINATKFRAYTQVQHSGVTNMFNVGKVMELSGLTREECLDIMKNYGQYIKQFEGR